MPKFYVQCGAIETILSADSIESAALAALDRTLQQHQWIYQDADLSEQDQRDHLMIESLLHLPPEIAVSQQGFDRADAARVGTPEMVNHWHRLMVSIHRLCVAAGFAPRWVGSEWTARGPHGRPGHIRRSPK